MECSFPPILMCVSQFVWPRHLLPGPLSALCQENTSDTNTDLRNRNTKSNKYIFKKFRNTNFDKDLLPIFICATVWPPHNSSATKAGPFKGPQHLTLKTSPLHPYSLKKCIAVILQNIGTNLYKSRLCSNVQKYLAFFLREWLSWFDLGQRLLPFLHCLCLYPGSSDRLLLAKMSHFTLFAAFLAAEQKVEPVSFRQRNGLGHQCFDTWNTIWTIWTPILVLFCNSRSLQLLGIQQKKSL